MRSHLDSFRLRIFVQNMLDSPSPDVFNMAI